MNSSFTTSTLALGSPAFADGAAIPAAFTCDGDQTNPPIRIAGVPAGVKSLALIMDDPDVPKALKPDGIFDHWILFNIPPETKEILSGAAVGIAGGNGAGKAHYTGPCPPKEYEPSEHRYFFKLYGLDAKLDLPVGSSKATVEQAMEGHVIAKTQLMGTYQRP